MRNLYNIIDLNIKDFLKEKCNYRTCKDIGIFLIEINKKDINKDLKIILEKHNIRKEDKKYIFEDKNSFYILYIFNTIHLNSLNDLTTKIYYFLENELTNKLNCVYELIPNKNKKENIREYINELIHSLNDLKKDIGIYPRIIDTKFEI